MIGIDKEEIQQYIDGALEHNKELRNQLLNIILGLMYVPLNCAIIVQIFREQMKNKSQPLQTHTEVYQMLIKTVLRHHEKKLATHPDGKSTRAVPHKCELNA